ncbi:low-density lipoprotein receptor-related protein 5-like protein [Diadema setosum]|uniref:low-density lipoprotein receptor-related protein 5-like protein n=1 Tax=Diadema setosum TaxID=31175 RepID=UPI003B3AFE78
MPQGGLIFVAEASGDIFVSDLGGDTLQFWPIPLGHVEYPVAVDYHPSQDLVFWSDVGLLDSSIHRANPDGSAQRTVFAKNGSVIDGLALDLTKDRLYWTDTGYDEIGSMDLDGSDNRVILSDDLDEPRAIVIHDGTRKMYWTDWGNAPKIEKANLDGSSREVIVDSQLIYPNGLAFSSDGQTLFWCDAARDRIESVDLNGENRQLLLATSGIHPFDLAVYGNRIVWSDWSHRALGYSDDGGATHSFIHDYVFERPMGIHLYPGIL